MSRYLFLIVFMFSTIVHGQAQSFYVENGPLFLQDEVARIDIVLPADSFAYMYEDVEYSSEHEFEATFIYTTNAFSDTVDQVGFRLRGNTSLEAAKKSFKVSFNSFTSGAQYLGVEKLNLNGEHNDVSLMRSKLGWEMLREKNLPASRTSYIRLYVNGEFMGVYLNVEHIDEEFVKKRFSPKVGNLYKCLWPATLQYLGSNPNAYKQEFNGNRIYDLKTNKYRDDYSGMANFITVLNNTADDDLKCALEPIFNVDDYLKIAAFDVLIGNWDGYIVNKNNFYLYENPASGRVEFINYDLDNTFGIDWFNVDWTNRNIYEWHFENRPLYERLMDDPAYREQFSGYVSEWMSVLFDNDYITNRAQEIQALIGPFVENDIYYTLDYGFGFENFQSSLTEAWGEHVAIGIGDYVEERRSNAMQDLEPFEPIFSIKEVRDSVLDLDTYLISAWIEGGAQDVTFFTLDDLMVIPYTMYDDGAHMDGGAGDGQWGFVFGDPGSDHIRYQVSAWDGAEPVDDEPCEGLNTLWFTQSDGPLYLNEVMPDNVSTIADELGEFDDWLEIYNASDSTVYLGDMYLTDDIHCPDKWNFQEFYSFSNDFQLIWADDDEEQGPFHTNFKLAGSGEEIALYMDVLGGLRLMDHIEFHSMAADHSFGRETDSGIPWVTFSGSSPGETNSLGTVGLEEYELESGMIFPNPANEKFYIRSEQVDQVMIYDLQGKLVIDKHGNALNYIETQSLVPSIYSVVLFDGDDARRLKLLIIR